MIFYSLSKWKLYKTNMWSTNRSPDHPHAARYTEPRSMLKPQFPDVVTGTTNNSALAVEVRTRFWTNFE